MDTTFNFCFTVPGTYTISQEVWVLGCSDFYSRELVVLPDLEITLDADSLICEDLPFALSIQSNRPVVEYLWSDGSTDPLLSVTEDGYYWLTGSDGYCSDSVGTELELLQLQLTEPIFILPEDTTICADHLPYTLEISGTYSEEFYNIETASVTQPFMLNEAGSYHFQTQIDGCTFDTVYHLTVSPCLANIFVPNIFTPNDDGVNDLLEVYGPEIKVLQLTVYDRWGGVVFDHQGSEPTHWDGTQGGQPVNPGVFIKMLSESQGDISR
jgi:gliding motility-associated-like protein